MNNRWFILKREPGCPQKSIGKVIQKDCEVIRGLTNEIRNILFGLLHHEENDLLFRARSRFIQQRTACILPAFLCGSPRALYNQWVPSRVLLYRGASHRGVLDSTDIMPIYGQESQDSKAVCIGFLSHSLESPGSAGGS